MVPQEALADTDDELAGFQADTAANAGYASMDGQGDVQDPREHRRIPVNTLTTLGILSFELNAKQAGKEYIFAKYECVAPEEYADESTAFGCFMNLSNEQLKTRDGRTFSPWGITSNELYWLAAAVITKDGTPVATTDPVVKDFFREAYAPFRETGINADNRGEFFEGLTALLNDKLAGKTFDTKIGVKTTPASKDGKYPERTRQTIGHPVFVRKNTKTK